MYLLKAATFAIGLCLISSSVTAQSDHAAPPESNGRVCAPRQKLVKTLIAEDGAPVLAGIIERDDGKKAFLEIWQSPDTNNWMAVITTADMISCIVQSGRDLKMTPYRNLDPRKNV